LIPHDEIEYGKTGPCCLEQGNVSVLAFLWLEVPNVGVVAPRFVKQIFRVER